MYLPSLCFFAASFSIVRSATERAIVTVHSSIQGKPRSATSSWTSINIFCPLDEDARIHRRIEHKKNRAAVATSPIAKEELSPSQRPIGHRFGSLGDECSICLPFTIEQIPKKKNLQWTVEEAPSLYVSRHVLLAWLYLPPSEKPRKCYPEKQKHLCSYVTMHQNMASPDYYNCNEHPIPFFVKSLHDKIGQSLSESIPNFLYT